MGDSTDTNLELRTVQTSIQNILYTKFDDISDKFSQFQTTTLTLHCMEHSHEQKLEFDNLSKPKMYKNNKLNAEHIIDLL